METVKEELFWNTVLGTIGENEKSLQGLNFVLGSENVFQDLSRFYKNDLHSPQISLEILESLRKNPFLVSSNLVLNDLNEMIHEIGILSKAKKIAIVDTTSFENGKDLVKLQKVSQNLGLTIFTGFDIFIDRKTLFQDDEKNSVFINKEAFMKKLALEFSLGAKEGVKYGFIGPAELGGNQKDAIESLKREAYFDFIKKTGLKIPIFFDFCGREEFETFDQLAGLIDFRDFSSQIVLINVPLIWEEVLIKEDKSFGIMIQLKNEEKILNLMKAGFHLVFGLYNQINGDFLLEFVKRLLEKGLSQRFSVSLGTRYKTNLRKYGGSGFKKIMEFRKKMEGLKGIDDIFQDNMLGILRWKTAEEVKTVAVKKWPCPHCKKEFDENIEKFRKFEKEFCSIKCLRQFFNNN